MFKIFFDINDINVLFCYIFLKKMLPFSSLASSRIFATFIFCSSVLCGSSSNHFSSSSVILKMQLFIYCFCSLFNIQIVIFLLNRIGFS